MAKITQNGDLLAKIRYSSSIKDLNRFEIKTYLKGFAQIFLLKISDFKLFTATKTECCVNPQLYREI